MSRLDRIRANLNTQVSGPTLAVEEEVEEDRADVAMREFDAYLKEPAAKNDSEFDLLQYWNGRGVDGLDEAGKVVVHARWPHLALLARMQV